jgi:multidrug efflux system membrane fusion protein
MVQSRGSQSADGHAKRQSSRLRWIGATLAVVIIAGGAVAWYLKAREHVEAGGPPPVPVTAGEAKSEDVPVYVRGLGTVQAEKDVAVKSRVDGQITGVFFRQGQEVKTGDKLFQIDPRPFQAALEQAQASKQKDEAAVIAAKLVLERYAQLVKSATQTQEAYDNQKATVAQLEASIAADQAMIDSAQLNLEYARITSPIDGRTGARLVDPGNLVQASQSTTLVTVMQLAPIFVTFPVPQEYLDRIRDNEAKNPLPVIAYASDDATRLSEGRLTFVDNHVELSTGTVLLKGTFANTDHRLWPGEFVSARLVLETREHAVTVPARTVMQGPEGAYVYIINQDDTVSRRDVTVASTQDGRTVIVSGVASGQRVVVDGQYRLTAGIKVAAHEEAAPPQSQARQANNSGGTAP